MNKKFIRQLKIVAFAVLAIGGAILMKLEWNESTSIWSKLSYLPGIILSLLLLIGELYRDKIEAWGDKLEKEKKAELKKTRSKKTKASKKKRKK